MRGHGGGGGRRLREGICDLPDWRAACDYELAGVGGGAFRSFSADLGVQRLRTRQRVRLRGVPARLPPQRARAHSRRWRRARTWRRRRERGGRRRRRPCSRRREQERVAHAHHQQRRHGSSRSSCASGATKWQQEHRERASLPAPLRPRRPHHHHALPAPPQHRGGLGEREAEVAPTTVTPTRSRQAIRRTQRPVLR